MQYIHTQISKNSKGHYTPAIVHNGLVYVSGQLPIDFAAGKSEPEADHKAQIEQALQNMLHVLELAGSSKDKVLKTTVYIANIELWSLTNQVYAEFFGEHRPARSIVPTSGLHYGSVIEIEAIACL